MPRSRALAAASCLSLFFLLSLGCSVDDRELHSDASHGGSGSDSMNGSQAGDDGPSPSGGGTAGTSSGSTLVDGCADLDTDGIGDCKATLVNNGAFHEDVSDWTASPGAELIWDEKNALDDLPSGSAKLQTTASRASGTQCLSMQGARLVIAYANAFVEDDTALGQAELQVSFFDSENCSGAPSLTFETPRSSSSNAWTIVQAGQVSASTTNSASIELTALKPDSAQELDVYFDNVMLKTKAP
ncbi:MAG TPA: hypothetical protein VEQ58_20855 [Polyangiaceae bacterium]|nr:hypothetical protein [Polyangiaceae bacterium]